MIRRAFGRPRPLPPRHSLNVTRARGSGRRRSLDPRALANRDAHRGRAVFLPRFGAHDKFVARDELASKGVKDRRERAPQLDRVAVDEGATLRVKRDRDRVAGQGRQGPDGVCEDPVQTDRAAMETDLAQLELRQLAHLGQHLRQPPARDLGLLEQLPLVIVKRAGAVLQQHPDVAGDNRQRRADLVSGKGDDLGPLWIGGIGTRIGGRTRRALAHVGIVRQRPLGRCAPPQGFTRIGGQRVV